MKNKFINLVLVLAILSILLITSVSAVATINTPAASTTITACGPNQIVNVTSTGVGSPSVNLVNLTIYMSSTLTANSSWTVVGRNNSANMTLLGNVTLTAINLSTSLEDANNYIINVTVRNATNNGFWEEDTNTGITVDCTVPTAPTSLTPTSDTDGSVDFSSTVTGRETTSCTLFFDGINPGATSYTMTHSGNSCTYTHSNMPDQTYRWYVRASDETNTTDSATQTTNVDIKTSSGKAALLIQQEGVRSKGGSLLEVTGTGNNVGFNYPVGPLTVKGWLIILGIIGAAYILYRWLK